MISNRDYFFPIVLLFLVFTIDKIFGIPWVVHNTYPYKKIERAFYESKEDLLEVFQAKVSENPNLKYGIILGSSRSGEYDSDQIRQIFPDFRTFNFSAPLAPPSFFYYWLTRIEEEQIPISYVIYEVDPILFSKASIRYSLDGSYSWKFVFENTSWWGKPNRDIWNQSQTGLQNQGFSTEEAETFFLKRLFALYKNPVDLKNIIANNSELKTGFLDLKISGFKGKDQKQKTVDTVYAANREKLGAFPNDLHFTNQSFFIEVDAENIFNLYLRDLKYSQTQIVFFYKSLELLAKKKIPVVFYVPMAAEPLRKRMEVSGILPEFTQNLSKAIEKAQQPQFTFLDPYYDKRWVCRDFFDSVHLSGKCFSNILPILFEPLQSKP